MLLFRVPAIRREGGGFVCCQMPEARLDAAEDHEQEGRRTFNDLAQAMQYLASRGAQPGGLPLSGAASPWPCGGLGQLACLACLRAHQGRAGVWQATTVFIAHFE